MKWLTPTLVGSTMAFAASASIPSSAHVGPWHVVSIGSMSGERGDDASALVSQERNCNADGAGCDKLGIFWQQGGRVVISARFQDCYGEDKDFAESYSVDRETWLSRRRSIEQQVTTDFQSWKRQAFLACAKKERIRSFDLRQIDQAVRIFSARLSMLDS